MKKTLAIFTYKGMVCAHCDTFAGNFIVDPNTVNPPFTKVSVDNVLITTEAKNFIKNNIDVAKGEFSYTNFLNEEIPCVFLHNISAITVLSAGPDYPVQVGNKNDLNVIDMVEEIDVYNAPPMLLQLLEENKGKLGIW